MNNLVFDLLRLYSWFLAGLMIVDVLGGKWMVAAVSAAMLLVLVLVYFVVRTDGR